MKIKKYIFLGKTLFFPDQGILAVGDLHLGFEYKMQQSGVLVPEAQVEEIKTDLKEIFDEIKEKNFKLKKIVFIANLDNGEGMSGGTRIYFELLRKLDGVFKTIVFGSSGTIKRLNIKIHEVIHYYLK